MGKISASIDLSKIDQNLVVEGRNGARYVNIAIYKNDEADRFGNTHAIKQEAPKEKRVQGQKTPYIGNGKEWEDRGDRQNQRPANNPPPEEDDDDDDSIPF